MKLKINNHGQAMLETSFSMLVLLIFFGFCIFLISIPATYIHLGRITEYYGICSFRLEQATTCQALERAKAVQLLQRIGLKSVQVRFFQFDQQMIMKIHGYWQGYNLNWKIQRELIYDEDLFKK